VTSRLEVWRDETNSYQILLSRVIFLIAHRGCASGCGGSEPSVVKFSDRCLFDFERKVACFEEKRRDFRTQTHNGDGHSSGSTYYQFLRLHFAQRKFNVVSHSSLLFVSRNVCWQHQWTSLTRRDVLRLKMHWYYQLFRKESQDSSGHYTT